MRAVISRESTVVFLETVLLVSIDDEGEIEGSLVALLLKFSSGFDRRTNGGNPCCK